MNHAALSLILAAAVAAAPACDTEVAPAPRAPAPAATPVPSAPAPARSEAAPRPGPPAVSRAAEVLPPETAAVPPVLAVAPASSPAPAAVPGAESEPGPDPVPVPAADPDPVPEPAQASPFPDDVLLAAGDPWIAPAGRSPIGGPGESSPAAALRLGEVARVRTAPAAEAVAWDAAHRYVGQRITVEGRVVNTHRSRSNVVFLNFDRDWKGKFYIPVFRSAHTAMSGPAEQFFLNQTVRVTGKVELFNGTPNIAVNQLSQISVVEGGRD